MPISRSFEIAVFDHECCGDALEWGELVRRDCVVRRGPDGSERLEASFHEEPREAQVEGRVSEIVARDVDGREVAVHRIPSGVALRGCDEGDDGHLEEPWTGNRVNLVPDVFVVTVR